MIPRDKMKNITHGQSNEGAELINTRAIRMDKTSQTHLKCSCACAKLMLQSGSRRQNNTRLALQDTFDKTTVMYVAIHYQHIHASELKH